ncbi:MAG: ATP-binding cassette domain-containing protein [Clostridia bacterium]|nr:ATP-binding cassette domain-containing protein [Clostridia bacterium]MBR6889921.1 ATP-binding cassette domain-containing protein [Clostridia bacterium]
MSDRVLEIDKVSKEYRLGMIGGGTLHGDLTSWFARVRGKDDPNVKIGKEHLAHNQRFWALKDVSFNVDKGDAVALLGRNGAGKSTMLKLISRITAPTEGEIRIRGRVASLLEIGTGFHRELSGRDNIYLNGAIMGMRRSEITARMKDIVEFSEIEPFIDTPVKRYSSGMYVKLAFAVAAHLDPDVMICDEVLAVGDLAFQQKCLGKMSEIARSGRAVLYVSHNMRTVSQLCNRGLYLDAGKLTYDGTVERAMELYGGSSARSVSRNLDEVPRYRDRGDTMRMLAIDFENTQALEYDQEGCMQFRLKCVSHIPEPRLRIRLILQNSIATPIAMTQTEPFEVAAEEEFTKRVRFPLDGIAPGEYIIKLSLIAGTPRGRSTYYDTIVDVSRFIITDDPAVNSGFIWNESIWGEFRLKPLEME